LSFPISPPPPVPSRLVPFQKRTFIDIPEKSVPLGL